MGRRGPPPKPTHLKLIAGNPGKKPLNTREPKPPTGVPRCPPWISPEGRQAWNRVADRLKKMRLLTLADGEPLITYAATYARWRECEEFIEKHGLTYPTRDGKGKITSFQQFPQVAISRNCLLILTRLQQEFGLTPASRSRIQIPLADTPDDHDKVFFGW